MRGFTVNNNCTLLKYVGSFPDTAPFKEIRLSKEDYLKVLNKDPKQESQVNKGFIVIRDKACTHTNSPRKDLIIYMSRGRF